MGCTTRVCLFVFNVVRSFVHSLFIISSFSFSLMCSSHTHGYIQSTSIRRRRRLRKKKCCEKIGKNWIFQTKLSQILQKIIDLYYKIWRIQTSFHSERNFLKHRHCTVSVDIQFKNARSWRKLLKRKEYVCGSFARGASMKVITGRSYLQISSCRIKCKRFFFPEEKRIVFVHCSDYVEQRQGDKVRLMQSISCN